MTRAGEFVPPSWLVDEWYPPHSRRITSADVASCQKVAKTATDLAAFARSIGLAELPERRLRKLFRR